MKKLSAFFLLCLITVALTACGKPADAAPDSISTDTTGSAAQTPTDTDGSGSGEEDADPNTRSFRDCTVSVVGYSLRKDENNDTALCVEYEFENNSKSSASFSTRSFRTHISRRKTNRCPTPQFWNTQHRKEPIICTPRC